MKRLLSCLAVSLLVTIPLSAQSDNDRHRYRDGHDRHGYDRHFDNRFRDRHFDRKFHERRSDHRFDRHRSGGRDWLRGNDPWRGHKGWSDYGGRQYDRFKPNSRASDHFAPRGWGGHRSNIRSHHDRHLGARSHHPNSRGHSSSSRRHRH